MLVAESATASAWLERMDHGGEVRLTLPSKTEHEEMDELYALFGRDRVWAAPATSTMQQHGFDLFAPPLNPATCPISKVDPFTEQAWQPWQADAYEGHKKRHVHRTKERAREELPAATDAEARHAAQGLVTPREVPFEAVGELKVTRDLKKLATVSGRRARRR